MPSSFNIAKKFSILSLDIELCTFIIYVEKCWSLISSLLIFKLFSLYSISSFDNIIYNSILLTIIF